MKSSKFHRHIEQTAIAEPRRIAAIKLYRYIVAAIALAGIVVSYAAIIPAPHVTRLRLTVNFFSYFTILTNLLVFFALALPGLASACRLSDWVQRPRIRAALLLYTMVTGLIYAVVLRSTWKPTGWQAHGDQILHYVVPVLYAIDWVLWTKRGLGWRDAFFWPVIPAAYAVYTLLHGQFSGFYPYPFVDVTEVGYSVVLTNMVALGGGFLALGMVIVLVDRIAARFQSSRRSGA